MKKIKILILLMLALLLWASGCKREVLTISGSETMYPMLQKLSGDYRYYQSDFAVDVNGGGSKQGITALIEGRVDIAASSLDFEKTLTDQLSAIGTFAIGLLAYDGIAVVTNRNNPVDRLSLQQLSDIFAGKIKNWKEVGGKDRPIQVIIRNSRSGTADYMEEHVLKQKDLGEFVYARYKNRKYDPRALVAGNNREIVSLISSNEHAISYMGMGSADTEGKGRVKKLKYALNEEGPFYEPTVQTVEKHQYKLARPLMLIYRTDNGGKVDKFIEYLKTKRARKAVLSTGYLDSIYSRLMLDTVIIRGKRDR